MAAHGWPPWRPGGCHRRQCAVAHAAKQSQPPAANRQPQPQVRPIDKQLQYQVDKLLKAAAAAAAEPEDERSGPAAAAGPSAAWDEDDAARYGPRPDAMVSKAGRAGPGPGSREGAAGARSAPALEASSCPLVFVCMHVCFAACRDGRGARAHLAVARPAPPVPHATQVAAPPRPHTVPFLCATFPHLPRPLVRLAGGAGAAGGDGIYRPPRLNPVSMEMDEERKAGGAGAGPLTTQERRRLTDLKSK